MFAKVIHWISERRLPLLCSFGLFSIGLTWAILSFVDHSTPTLRMSAGPEATRRYAVAQYLCEQASDQGLAIRLSQSAGSEDCLNLLKAGQLDAAIISTGVKVPDDENITVLGVLQPEAVHIIVRKGIADGKSLPQAIRGKRINLGEKGSTEWLLAREFLSFARLKFPTATTVGDFVQLEQSKKQLKDRCNAIQNANSADKQKLIDALPDCFLMLATMPGDLPRLLIETGAYEIKPMQATRAFLSDQLQDSHSKDTIVEREFLERITIPACSYFAAQGYPDTDCETVGVRLLVVANKNVSARAIQPLMKTLFEGKLARRIQSQSPTEIATQYDIHSAAIAYFDKDKPIVIMKQAMDWCKQGLSFFGAFSAGALSLYSLVWRKKTRKPTDYLSEIRKLGQSFIDSEKQSKDSAHSKETTKHLDEQLQRLRQNLIEDVCEGRIKGDQSVFNILMLLKETRRDLPVLDRAPTESPNNASRQERPSARAA